MKQKTLTNDKALALFIKEVNKSHPLISAVLRERILHIMELTMDSINNEPSKWNNPFIHPNCYVELNKIVQDKLGFNEGL
jgi:hypothetical protein